MKKAILFLPLFLGLHCLFAQPVIDSFGAIVRSDTSQQQIYLCFTGHDFHEGFAHVLTVLQQHQVSASFFLTGDFVRNQEELVKKIAEAGHFVGAHSDKHLLYCDWTKRDSLLHSPDRIRTDIWDNLQALSELGIQPAWFMPPYEWYNQQVVAIATELGQTTVNFSPGTRSNADYTTPEMPNYRSTAEILESIYAYEAAHGLNGFHLLIHPGTNPLRTDKLYLQLDSLLTKLEEKGYRFGRFR